MTEIQTLVSLLFNASGTMISVSGAIYNAKGHHKTALLLWVISNLILLAFFIGIAMGWLILNSGAWMQVGLYCVFLCTSCYGYWRIIKKEEKNHG